MLFKDHLTAAGEVFSTPAGGVRKHFKTVSGFTGCCFSLFVSIIYRNVCFPENFLSLPLECMAGLFTGIGGIKDCSDGTGNSTG